MSPIFTARQIRTGDLPSSKQTELMAWFKTAINRVAVQLGTPSAKCRPPKPKSAFFSGNMTHSANSLGGRRGGWCSELVLDGRAFLALRQFLAWRKAKMSTHCPPTFSVLRKCPRWAWYLCAKTKAAYAYTR
jgi:hypothetical protein